MKYVPGPAYGQFSGSQGNTTASHNRYGSYLRNRVIPVNPNTGAQTVVRSAFTNFSQAWRTLSAAAQDGWSALALLEPILDGQGQSVILSGQAYYVSFNMNRRSAGLARLDAAPALVELPPSIESMVIAAAGGAGTIGYTPVVIGGTATNFQVLYATGPKSAGVNFFGKSDFRVIAVIAGDAPALPPEAIQTQYEAVWGTGWQTSVGMKIAIRALGVSDTGFVGDFTQAQLVIAA